jgi:protein PhnA
VSDLPACPKCSCTYTYEIQERFACPECSHQWTNEAQSPDDSGKENAEIRDSSGNVLHDGDTVSVVKDLKVKGRPTSIKIGTKVRNIRLVYNNGDHDIDCKIDGFGAMYLKSTVVKKV